MPRRVKPGARDRILDVAAALFYGRGIRAVGMQQVIDEADCGKNLLYQQFPSKTELVAGYLERTRQEWDRQADSAAREAGADPAAQLMALIGVTADVVRAPRYRGCPFRNFLTEFPDHDDPAGRIATAYLRDTRAQIDTLVRRLDVAEPDVLAERIWLVLEGLFAAAAHSDRARCIETAESLVADLLAAAGPLTKVAQGALART
jgi:AcrR family transcriptional regulator